MLSSILKFSKASDEVSKVPSRTRGGGVVKILGGVGVPFFLCVRFCCLDLVGYPLQLLVLKFFLIQCLYLPLSGLVVCLGIYSRRGWAGVSCLVLKEVSASVVAEAKAVEAELYNNIGEARVAFGIKTSK